MPVPTLSIDKIIESDRIPVKNENGLLGFMYKIPFAVTVTAVSVGLILGAIFALKGNSEYHDQELLNTPVNASTVEHNIDRLLEKINPGY